jgi:hypothetical protein
MRIQYENNRALVFIKCVETLSNNIKDKLKNLGKILINNEEYLCYEGKTYLYINKDLEWNKTSNMYIKDLILNVNYDIVKKGKYSK